LTALWGGVAAAIVKDCGAGPWPPVRLWQGRKTADSTGNLQEGTTIRVKSAYCFQMPNRFRRNFAAGYSRITEINLP
jgi:hypothetical protein